MCGPGQARRQEASANTLEDDGGGPWPGPGGRGAGEATGQVLRLLGKRREPGLAWNHHAPSHCDRAVALAPGGQTVKWH